MSSEDSSQTVILLVTSPQRAILYNFHTVKQTSVFLEKYLKINTNKSKKKKKKIPNQLFKDQPDWQEKFGTKMEMH